MGIAMNTYPPQLKKAILRGIRVKGRNGEELLQKIEHNFKNHPFKQGQQYIQRMNELLGINWYIEQSFLWENTPEHIAFWEGLTLEISHYSHTPLPASKVTLI